MDEGCGKNETLVMTRYTRARHFGYSHYTTVVYDTGYHHPSYHTGPFRKRLYKAVAFSQDEDDLVLLELLLGAR